MTKGELIKELEEFPDETIIMILDSFNGGGFPREINLGPVRRQIEENDAAECADCEEMLDNGHKDVVVIGYGCY